MIRLGTTICTGALFGLLTGAALQLGREFRQERAQVQLAQEFAPWSPPLMIDLLKPEAIPLATSLMFALLGAIVYVAWSRRSR
jgi:hypothetical protein